MNNKIRVLQLVNGELYGGAERIQEIILENLDRSTFEPYCVAVIDGDFVQRLREKGLSINLLRMRGKGDISIIDRVRRFVNRRNIDIIHTHTVRTNTIGRLAAMFAGIPVVTHVHSSPLYETDNRIKNKINQYVESFTRKFSDGFICVSNQLKGQLVSEGVDPGKVVVVKNGVELDRFDVHNSFFSDKLEDNGLDPNPGSPVVTMVAYFRPLKGVKVLLESIALVKEKSPENNATVSLYLVGEFESDAYRRKVEREVEKLGLKDMVKFVGFSSKVEEILWVSDLFVLPSLFGEGIPVSILEAMAMEVPVIASAVGGVPEVIKDGETGFLVPPGDELALANKINKVLFYHNSRDEIVKRARDFLEDQHDIASMVESIEEVYLNLVD